MNRKDLWNAHMKDMEEMAKFKYVWYALITGRTFEYGAADTYYFFHKESLTAGRMFTFRSKNDFQVQFDYTQAGDP